VTRTAHRCEYSRAVGLDNLAVDHNLIQDHVRLLDVEHDLQACKRVRA
jgi:hypothetical protein